MTVRLSVFELPLNSGFAIISHDFPFVNTFFQSFLQIFFGLVQSLCHAFLCRLFFAATPLYYHIISSLSTPFLKVFWVFFKKFESPDLYLYLSRFHTFCFYKNVCCYWNIDRSMLQYVRWQFAKARQRFGQTKYATYAPVAQLDRAQASDAWLSQVRILFGVPKNYGESQMRFRFWLSPFFLRYSWSSVSSSSDDSSFLSGSLSFSSFFLDCSSFSSRDLRFFSSRIASSSS